MATHNLLLTFAFGLLRLFLSLDSRLLFQKFPNKADASFLPVGYLVEIGDSLKHLLVRRSIGFSLNEVAETPLSVWRASDSLGVN